MVRARGKGRPGRGCCGRCWTPYNCARGTICGCHTPQGESCRYPGCGAGLYVALPDDVRPEVEGFERELATIREHPYKVGKVA